MSVYSLETTMNLCVDGWLRSKVPDDTEAMFYISTHTYSCPNGGSDHIAVRLQLLFTWEDEDGDERRAFMVGALPMELLSDGDMEPLEEVLDSLWDEVVFFRMTIDLMPMLAEVEAEVTGED